jgi:phage antirepressor YoqD-like protein
MDNNSLIEVLEGSKNHLTKLQNTLEVLAMENKQLKEVNKTWERVSKSDDTVEMSVVAKVLKYKSIGRNKMFKILREAQILRHNNEPYQQYIDRGYFDLVEQDYDRGLYGVGVNQKPVVTQKGIDFIRKIVDRSIENG